MMNEFEASQRRLVTINVEKSNDDENAYTVRLPIPGTRRKVHKAFILGHLGIGQTCFLSYVLAERFLGAQPVYSAAD